MHPQYSPRFVVRFWHRANRDGSCWEWLGYCDPAGYGRVSFHSTHAAYAHRIAYELSTGTTIGGGFVCHRCGNPRCIRPSHLYLGTAKSNADDRSAHGRLTGNRRLTAAQVRAIRTRCANGEPQKIVAAVFGISESSVSRIIHRQSWARGA